MRRLEIPEEPATLQAGELHYCDRCRDRHVMEPDPSADTTPYARDMLFALCHNGKRYYVGQIGYPATWHTSFR